MMISPIRFLDYWFLNFWFWISGPDFPRGSVSVGK